LSGRQSSESLKIEALFSGENPMKYRLLCVALCLFCLNATAYAESSFDRELVVKNTERAVKVENVLKELLRAYENEDAREFLDYVSEDRFRHDYLTFTDALYTDFRTYEIHRIDYWVDRVVADHIKQFLYVRWEKRYETLDEGRQYTERGFSRFVFDEINGDYLLVELAGNDLFGSSLPEWTEETPSIPGQEASPNPDSGNNNPPAGLADLVIQSTGYVPAFGSITVNNFDVVIANNGSVASGPTVVNVITAVSGNLDQINIPAIPAGGTYSFTSVTGYEIGLHVASVSIDPNNVVPETNDANNQGGPYPL